MGYETSFYLTIEDLGEHALDEIEAAIKAADMDFAYEGYGEPARWYNCTEEMCAFSARFPTALFCLRGDGEDSEDFWHEYYKGGKHQFCPAYITYAPFNEGALREFDGNLVEPDMYQDESWQELVEIAGSVDTESVNVTTGINGFVNRVEFDYPYTHFSIAALDDVPLIISVEHAT